MSDDTTPRPDEEKPADNPGAAPPATEAENPRSRQLDRRTAAEIVDIMCAEDAEVAVAVARERTHIAAAIDLISERLAQGGRLIYIGAGTSGRLGILDASECPPTFDAPPGLVVGVIAGGPRAISNTAEGAEDERGAAARDLKAIDLEVKDVVVGIAASGGTRYAREALETARGIGAGTVALACVPHPPLAEHADVAITPVTGPEIVTGSTRLKAGTATKMVLNMLSTGAMIRLGRVYDNLMVDLQASNAKLRARACRIVTRLTGLPDPSDLLERSDWEVKTAIVCAVCDVDTKTARTRLAKANGRLRDVVGDLP